MAEKTFFASPDREEKEAALAESRELASRTDLQLVMKVVPECAAVLNDSRQVLMANEPLLDLLSARDLEEIVGSRPGRRSDASTHLTALEDAGPARVAGTAGPPSPSSRRRSRGRRRPTSAASPRIRPARSSRSTCW